MTAARRKMVDGHRRRAAEGRALSASATGSGAGEETGWEAEVLGGGVKIPDERLKLLFLCAHPAIDAGVHTPLMLQCVLGLDAAEIASAFLVPPAAMSQRLVRAKTKIRQTAMRFELPEEQELRARLEAVLTAVYAAYGAGWESATVAGETRGLAQEAIWLGRVLAELMPDEPEVLGLLALMLYSHSRRNARRVAGRFVPLMEQACERWDRRDIAEAESLLKRAAQRRLERGESGLPGRHQLEAAIQSVHAARALTGEVDWEAVAQLYRGLMAAAPSVGAAVGLAAALGEAGDVRGGLAVLDELAGETVAGYQPYWATRGMLLLRAGEQAAGRDALERACGLTEDEAVREYLRGQMAGR